MNRAWTQEQKNAIDAPSTLDINKLAQDLLEEIIKGNGDKKIFISSDDEGNSYHRLFYTIDTVHVWRILVMNRFHY